MVKVLELFFFACVVTMLYGFPQKPPQKPQISSSPNRPNLKKQGHVQNLDPLRRPRDVERKPHIPPISLLPLKENLNHRDDIHQNPNQRDRTQNKPLDRSQISTLPANFAREGIHGNNNINRKTRDTDEETKTLDRSQIGTLPATIKFEDSETRESSENEKNKNAENDDSKENVGRDTESAGGEVKIELYGHNTDEPDTSESS